MIFSLLFSNVYEFLAHLYQWLMVSYCDSWMSVVHCVVVQQLLQRTSSPKLLGGFLPILAGMILICIMALFNNCSNGSDSLHI